MADKENTAPLQLGHVDDDFGFSPFRKEDLKSRSKSIGPGDIQNTIDALRDRRQSLFNNNTVRGILPDREDAERKAARRKSMANRRVSFAPEATLHTWDVIDHMRDHTTSTDDTQSTRQSPNSAPPQESFSSPSSQLVSDDDNSSQSGSDEELGSEEDEDATGTAMSLISDAEMTQDSVTSGGSSTSSSLDRNLRLAAQTAGTRGIEYDEFGEMSMEIANEEITNAFQPWVQQETDERRGSAAYDQENMNPFVNKPSFQPSETGEATMDVTHVVGGVIPSNIISSPFNEVPMDMTLPLGSIKSQFQFSPQKRARPADAPSSGPSPSKRVRSRYSLASNQTAQWDATMDFTQAVGGIRAPSEFSFDGNEELSMELTGVIGGISRHIDNTYRQAPPEASSPFRIAADNTITKLVQQEQIDDAQSPTPRARDSSARRSSARLRRASMNESQADAALESSPTQRRSSRRLSAKSPSLQSAETDASPVGMSTPVQALTRMQLSSARQKSPKSASKSPRSVAKSPKSATKSPKSLAVTPPQVQSLVPSTPPAVPTASKSITEGIKLMITPRKEFLKPVTPRKATPSPLKRPRSATRVPPQLPAIIEDVADEQVEQRSKVSERQSGIHLQDFLNQAGIRFMELTTSKRRLTVATTPSRLRQTQIADNDVDELTEITLEDAVVAAACTEPELELYKHACHELKRYIDEGKADIKILEAETYKETPLLVQTYMSTDEAGRTTLDAQMRDVKTNARLRSKEMWYGWRSNLVDDLMKALQAIAEDLIADDEILQKKEETLANTLPLLQEQRTTMQTRVEELLTAVPRDEDKIELDEARQRLTSTRDSLEEKRRMLSELQGRLAAVDERRDELVSVKDDHLLTICTADQLKADQEIVSGSATTKLKDAVSLLQSKYNWSIASASADPPCVVLAHKSQLELFFHPNAFNRSQPTEYNAPISLKYTGTEAACTTKRFVLQLLKAHLQIMSQASTNISNMLNLVAAAWKTTSELIEAERLLSIEGPVKTTIINDNCLAISTYILLPAVKTKVCATFSISMALEGTDCKSTVQKSVKVVYGEPYNEKNMSEFLIKHTDPGFETWPSALRQLRQKLVERGPKTLQSKV